MQEYTAQGLWVPSTADTDDLDDIINHIDAVEMRVRESYDDNVWVERAHLLKGLRTQIRSLVYSSENVALLRRRASVVDERKVESSDDVTDQRTVYKWIRLGFNLESAMKIASASIGAEARHFEGHPTYVVAKQAFVSKRVSVALSDLEPSPEFITAVKDAMSSSSPEERKEALDEVMDRWGQFIATSVELGCAVVASKETQNASPQDVVEDLHVRMVTLLGANANNSQDSTPSPASSLPLVFMGGRGIAMRDVASWLNTIDEESGWTTISVLEVHRTIDLIRNLDQELYRQAAEMLATPRPEEALPVSPSPPIYQFDGRITTFRYQDSHRLNGFIETPLPSFNPHADFTVSVWVYGGEPGGNACALSIESPKWNMPILRIAEFDKNRFFVASIRRDISDPNKQCAIHLSTARVEWRFGREKWYHLSLVKDERRVRFFVDNTIIDSMDCEQLKPYDAPKPQLCIGRSSWEGKKCDQWDGAVEGVKIWDRAISMDEIKAASSKKPGPGGWGAPRFT